MMLDLLLRTAHTTSPEETWAQDGLPIAVVVPVEMKLPQAAQAEGDSDRQTANGSKKTEIRFMIASPENFVEGAE
jgi:hypothetical protein